MKNTSEEPVIGYCVNCGKPVSGSNCLPASVYKVKHRYCTVDKDDKCHLCGCVGFHYDSCPHWPGGTNNPETKKATGWGDVTRGMAYDGEGNLTSITVDGVVFVPQVEMNKVTEQAVDEKLMRFVAILRAADFDYFGDGKLSYAGINKTIDDALVELK